MTNNTTNESNKPSGLRSSYLSSIEVMAQSIAGIAPSVTPALVIPLVFGFAGNGTWLAYFFGTIAIVLVGANLNQFTKRSASPGNLYAFIVKGLGPGIGVISGWALVLAYILTASAVLCGFINYVNVLLAYVGITLPAILIGIIGALTAWFIAVKDIKLSARLMLAFEHRFKGMKKIDVRREAAHLHRLAFQGAGIQRQYHLPFMQGVPQAGAGFLIAVFQPGEHGLVESPLSQQVVAGPLIHPAEVAAFMPFRRRDLPLAELFIVHPAAVGIHRGAYVLPGGVNIPGAG